MPVLGVVVNPVAGLGGPAGLHGTDPDDVDRALARGAVPRASERAARALAELRAVPGLRVRAGAEALGADAARAAGLTVDEVGPRLGARTRAADTRSVVAALGDVDLLLFVGGDGTARDVLASMRPDQVVLGVPAGVKMRSGVFARSPRAAGRIAGQFLRGRAGRDVAEVVDQDVDGYRLHGSMVVPQGDEPLPTAKSGTLFGSEPALAALCRDVADSLDPATVYVVGPGTTTAAVLSAAGLPSTMLGVDVTQGGRLLVADASEQQLVALLDSADRVEIVLGVVGDQGFLLGRGNQQLSAPVLARAARLRVLASRAKLAALGSAPLLVDLDGAADVPVLAAGFVRVQTGPQQDMIMPVELADDRPRKVTYA